MAPEYVGNWTTSLAYCTFCKVVFQNMHDAAGHEKTVHGRVLEPLDETPASLAVEPRRIEDNATRGGA